jgi:hypothetical protein
LRRPPIRGLRFELSLKNLSPWLMGDEHSVWPCLARLCIDRLVSATELPHGLSG